MAIWPNGLCSKNGEWVTGLDRTRYPSDFYDYKSTCRANKGLFINDVITFGGYRDPLPLPFIMSGFGYSPPL